MTLGSGGLAGGADDAVAAADLSGRVPRVGASKVLAMLGWLLGRAGVVVGMLV